LSKPAKKQLKSESCLAEWCSYGVRRVCAVNISFTFPVSTLQSISAVFECCEFVTVLLVLA